MCGVEWKRGLNGAGDEDECGVEWECGLDGAGDADDDILGMGWEVYRTKQVGALLKAVYQQTLAVI